MASLKLLWGALAACSLAIPVSAHAEGNAGNIAAERIAEDPELAFARAISGLEQLTAFNQQTWDQGGVDWSVYLDEGIIEFSNDKGWLISAPVQVIGTYDTRDGSFMWGWKHPSVPEASAVAAQLVHDYGERHDLGTLTTNLVSISEDEAWELTALAAYLSESQGAYRGPIGTTLVYMTFGTITITKP